MPRRLIYDTGAEYFLGSIHPQKTKTEKKGPGHTVTVKNTLGIRLLGPLRTQVHRIHRKWSMVLSCG